MKKKFPLIRISYILLAVTLIGAVLGVKTYTCSNKTEHDGSFNTTNKAMSPSCRKSLEYANNTNATTEFMKMWWARGEGRLDAKTLKPNAVVAQDGSGPFRTIMDAVRTVPKNNRRPFVIFIKKGIYDEYVKIPEHVNNVTFIAEGPTKTRITGNTSHNDVPVSGDGFMARGIGLENMAGPLKYQAVALRVSDDMAIFYNCAMNGYQDTQYAHSNRQFYRQCTITGTIDFIFGDASAVFQACKMIVRKLLDNQECTVTA
ncbi:putative pectinesterase [Helianthus debilis subsp. tardiflorus]